jgi:hypothetical protein
LFHRGSLDGLRGRVAAALARAGLDRPEVSVQAVDRLERFGGVAKLKRFLPLDRTPAPQALGQTRAPVRPITGG